MILKDIFLTLTASIKSLFNEDVYWLLVKCENLESLDERRCKEIAEERRKYHKEYEDYQKYVEEVDREYQKKYQELYGVRKKLLDCQTDLNILTRSDKGQLFKQLKNKEEEIKILESQLKDKIKFLESQLEIANDKTKECKDFIESLPESYKCAYELYVKNKGNDIV